MQQLTELRHHYPILRRGRFLTGAYNEELGVKDVTWINAAGAGDDRRTTGTTPSTRCFGMLMDGRAQATGIRRPASDATLLMVLNAHHDVVEFTLPPCAEGRRWNLVFDTNIPDDDQDRSFDIGEVYTVTGRSVLLLALEATRQRRRGTAAG